MAQAKKLIFSRESAQLLLEGLKFFQENPQAKDWRGLGKNTFLLLARDVAQFYPNKEEDLTEYLIRFESFLRRIINNEELAPSIPQNLEELVAAFEAFKQEKNAQNNLRNLEEASLFPASQNITIENWIKNLQEKHLRQRTKEEIEQEVALTGLPEKQETSQKQSLADNIAAILPRTVIPSPEEEEQTARKIKNILDQGLVNLIIKEKEPLAKKIAQRARFLTIPTATKPPTSPEEQILVKTISQVIKDKTPIKDPSRIQKTAQEIAQGLIQKTPKLTVKEKNSLTEMEKITLTEEVVNASLPEIVSAIIKPSPPAKTETPLPSITAIALSPKESQEFLQEITGQAKEPLFGLSIFLSEELELEKTVPNHQTKSNQKGAILDQLSKNPLLPYQLTPQENQTSLATQMRQVVGYHGISPKSAEIINYQNEEVTGFTNSLTGKTSPWWQNQINLFQARGENQNLIDQAVTNLDLQAKFETNFPQLGNFYQEATTWAKAPRWFNPITNFFKEKLGNLWGKTAIAKSIAKGVQSKTGLFLKKTLGSFNIFAGAKKAFQEGVKRGATKTVTWLAKKLAATKLGAALGSIAPGIGNAIGAIIGFGVDIIKGGLNLFSSTLQKITGGETEAEKTIKVSLGPLGKFILSPVTMLVVGAPIIIIVLALNLFQAEGSAFILDEEAISGLPFPNLPSEKPITSNHLAERLVQILQECPATKPNGYINQTNFPQIAQCLEEAGISSNIIDILKNSADQFFSLQCVGFVRAVEAGLNRTLPSCGNAKDYSSCQAVEDSPNYEYTSCQNLKVGAIGVFTGGTYGHVGVITAIEPSDGGIIRVRFASAWGTSTEDGGRVTITTLPCDSLSALIQPKN